MGLAPLKLVLAKLNVIHVVITHGIILSLCLSGDPSNGLCDYRIIFLWGYQEQPVKPWDVQPFFCQAKGCKQDLLSSGPHIFDRSFPLCLSFFACSVFLVVAFLDRPQNF